MELAKAVRDFREVCERILAAIASKRQLNKVDVWILQFYYKQLLFQIEPYKPQQSSKQ